MINIRHLRAFVAVAEQLHFTRAAATICVTQPALSALIRQTELTLGAQLIQRNSRLVELTDIGLEFLERARSVLAAFDGAIVDMRDYRRLKRGRLAIAALPSLCVSLLPPIMQAFSQQHPQIDLIVHDLAGRDMLAALRERTVDLALGYAPGLDDIQARNLLCDRLMLVRRGATPPEATLTWAALASRPIIAMAAGTTIRALTDEAAGTCGVDLRIMLEPRLLPTAIAYVEAGLGDAILPSTGLASLCPPTLARIVLTDPVVTRDVAILSLRDHGPSPAAIAFQQLTEAVVRTLG